MRLLDFADARIGNRLGAGQRRARCIELGYSNGLYGDVPLDARIPCDCNRAESAFASRAQRFISIEYQFLRHRIPSASPARWPAHDFLLLFLIAIVKD